MKKVIKKNINLIFLVIFVFVISLFLLTVFELDSDYLWHIKAGEYMFKHGILTHDVFSWSVLGKYWMSHEWGTEYILYLLKYLFGNINVFIYCYLLVGGLLFFLLFSNLKNYKKNMIFSCIWIVCSLILIPFIQARPHLFSFLLLGISFYVLYDLYNNENSKKIFILPIITIIWSNVHGGSSNLPYLLCIIFFIGGLFKFKFNKIEANRFSKKQLLKYLIIGFICILCVSINPHGIKMLFYPYENMTNSVMINNISEWKSTSLNIPLHYVYFSFILFIFIVFITSKKKIKFIDFLFFGFSVYLGLKAIRFWAYTYIIMNYIVFNYISEKKLDYYYLLYSCLSLMLLCMFISNFNNLKDINFKNKYLNNEVINILKRENPKRLFNMYDYGGELVNNNIKVFVDGRADLYSKYNYLDYLTLSNLNGNYNTVIEEYNFDYYLVSKKYPIYYLLQDFDNLEILYETDTFILYKVK